MSNDSNNAGGGSGNDDDNVFKKRKNPKRIAQLTQASDVLQGLLQNSKSQLSDGFVRWRLEQEWPEIVGETIAAQTMPCAFDKGLLFIWVKHPTWMQQLHFFQNDLKEKVNAHLGYSWAKQIKFTLNRRAATTEPGSSRD